MSKDQWIAQVEAIVENYDDGEMDCGTAIEELSALGMLPDDIKKTLDHDGIINIPPSYIAMHLVKDTAP